MKVYQEAFSTKWSVIQLLNDTINGNVFQFATPTKKNQINSNNTESLTLQIDGPITGRAYIRNIFSVYKRGGGGGGDL